MAATHPDKAVKIRNSISKCSSCLNNVPLFFDILGQKAMIITAAGTLQSMFFPLIMVRFVRNMLYSLFGKNGLTETVFQKLFNSDGIYWTSFHKCYDRHFLRTLDGSYAMDALRSAKCAKKFLQREIDAVQPELLIILGKAVCSEVQRMVADKDLILPANQIFSDYFHLEPDTSKIDHIRNALAQTLCLDPPQEPFDKTAAATTKTNAEVHLQFQLCAARALSRDGGTRTDLPVPTYENVVEQLWIENVATPVFSRYYSFLNYWSAIESSTESFLCNNYDPTNPNQNNPQYRPLIYDESISMLHNMKEIRRDWLKKLNDYYLTRRDHSLLARWKAIYRKLVVLRDIRNAIVHQMGFIPYKTVHIQDTEYSTNYNINARLVGTGFQGIRVIPNMVYIQENGIKELDDLFVQIAALLSDSEKDPGLTY
ncbi:MAG: hypothetical protein GXX89_10640 [Clostridiales bacterium]|jgi:hypothetical protein|nr:hypothetical protein [Clostridiales bacterium]